AALKFSVLQQSKQKDVVFDKDKMLSFEGDTGPYVQYSHVRCNSILAKTKEKPVLKAKVQNDSEKQLIKTVLKFPIVVSQAARQYEVHLIAHYALQLTQDFNSFYRDSPVLTAKTPALLKQRLAFVTATKNTLKKALYLLGINAPDKM
ncbi:MAG: arginine--tRNA ligase, partial [Candidatus Diapherotrites archaeon]|nr:arginine--tRNA ligase [Candidatus Diapherotrites archaeon]